MHQVAAVGTDVGGVMIRVILVREDGRRFAGVQIGGVDGGDPFGVLDSVVDESAAGFGGDPTDVARSDSLGRNLSGVRAVEIAQPDGAG